MRNYRGYAIGGLAAIVAAGLLWWGMGGEPARNGEPDGTNAAAAPPSDVLPLTPDQLGRLAIRTAPAMVASSAPIAQLPAVVVPPPGARVAVAAALPGVVVRTMAVEGDSVRRGQPLAVIASRDVVSLSGDLVRARARLGVASSSAQRMAQLQKAGVVAGARLDEAQAQAAEARADVAEKARILDLVNGRGGNGTYTLVAPIAGRVTKAMLQAGDPVDGTGAPYVIDAVDRYEVEAQLPERLAGQARPGMGIRLGAARGTVTSVGSTIDPATRSIMLKAKLPAGPGVIAGRATSVTLEGPPPAGAVSVPAEAVTSLDGHEVVFVRTRSGFRIRTVASGATSDGQALLLSGVKPGELIAVTGTSALKALALAR
jgi:cobalt-zinc-cadmium efflux system membrane fusion protein